jgi:hypothetical protein
MPNHSKPSDSTQVYLSIESEPSSRHDWTTNDPRQLLHSNQTSTTTQHYQNSLAPMKHGSRYSRHNSGYVVRRYGAEHTFTPNGRSGCQQRVM